MGPLAQTVSTFVGSGAATNLDGTGLSATIFGPLGSTVEPSTGDLLVTSAGSDHKLRRINTQTAVVTTFSGGSGSGYSDGSAFSALFDNPTGVAVTPWHGGLTTGEALVSDKGNTRLRAVASDGTASTLAGNSGFTDTDGTGTGASFQALNGICVDSLGNAYITTDAAIRKVTPAGAVTTIVGDGVNTVHLDGTGTAARVNNARGVDVDDRYGRR